MYRNQKLKDMKKVLIITSLISLFLIGLFLQQSKKLINSTDYFVEELDVKYSSYGILNDYNQSTEFFNLPIVVTPIGRVFIVKVDEYVDDNKYKMIETILKNHYRNDNRVNDVYRNNGGTITIDCRK